MSNGKTKIPAEIDNPPLEPAEVAAPIPPQSRRTTAPSDAKGRPIYVGSRVHDHGNSEGGIVIAAGGDSLLVEVDVWEEDKPSGNAVMVMVASDVVVANAPPVPLDKLPDPRPLPPMPASGTPDSRQAVADYAAAMFGQFERAFAMFEQLREMPDTPADDDDADEVRGLKRKLDDLYEWVASGEDPFRNAMLQANWNALQDEVPAVAEPEGDRQ